MKESSAFSVGRLLRATSCSLAGVAAAWRSEASFRLEVAAAVVLIPLGVWLGNSGVERALLAGSVVMVLMVELVNSSLESIADVASPGYNPLVKRAKDLGSAAVMAALALGALVWLSILI